MTIRKLADGRYEVKLLLGIDDIHEFQVDTYNEAINLDAVAGVNQKLCNGDPCTRDEIVGGIAALENVGIVSPSVLHNRFTAELRKQLNGGLNRHPQRR